MHDAIASQWRILHSQYGLQQKVLDRDSVPVACCTEDVFIFHSKCEMMKQVLSTGPRRLLHCISDVACQIARVHLVVTTKVSALHTRNPMLGLPKISLAYRQLSLPDTAETPASHARKGSWHQP